MEDYIKDLEVKGSTMSEKQEKLIKIKKYLENKGAKSSYQYTDSPIPGEGWLTYKLNETDIHIWVRKPNPLEFLISESVEKGSDKKSQDCAMCSSNIRYTVRVQTNKSPQNVDSLFKELSSLI